MGLLKTAYDLFVSSLMPLKQTNVLKPRHRSVLEAHCQTSNVHQSFPSPQTKSCRKRKDLAHANNTIPHIFNTIFPVPRIAHKQKLSFQKQIWYSCSCFFWTTKRPLENPLPQDPVVPPRAFTEYRACRTSSLLL